MGPQTSIFVAGSTGMVGSAVTRRLKASGYTNLLLPNRAELDLMDSRTVDSYFRKQKPGAVVVAAARVGGIAANDRYPVEFLADNLRIECNVIQSAAEHGCERLLFLGSSCIYPKLAPQPIPEESLLTGPLEPTNEAYALAKIAGLKLCDYYLREYKKRFISAMPTNLYGPGDNFHPENSHVIPGLLRRFHEAKTSGSPTVKVWGSGKPVREFLHVDDLAEALVMLLERYEGPGAINVGTGTGLPIRELAELIAEISGFRGKIEWDASRPDGTPHKVLRVDRIAAFGWKARTPLKQGLASTYQWAVQHGKI